MFRRSVTTMAGATLLLGTGYVVALADSADPKLPFHASVQLVGGQPVLTLDGEWQWTTHHSNCNTNRYAVGWAVDWHDTPAAPGSFVANIGNPAQPVNVGTPTDNKVHFMHLAGDPASGKDSGDANTIFDPVGNTRCGTYDAGAGFNSGVWGPIKHTYPAGTTTFNACVVTYDMHNSGGGLKAGDDVAGGNGHNKDNSVQSNQNTPLGNQCFSFHVPTVTTHVSAANVANGVSFTDTAELTGYDPNNLPPGGSFTWTLHTAIDNNGAHDCGTQVGGTIGPVIVSQLSPGVYGAVSPSVTKPAGDYYWHAHYSGDAHNAAVDGNCDDQNEKVTVAGVVIPTPTLHTQVSNAAVHTGTPVTDTATITGGNNPTGDITFDLFTDNNCNVPVSNPAYVSSVVPIVAGQATSAAYTPTSAQTLYWQAHYSGDNNNNPADEPCTANNEQTVVTLDTPVLHTQVSSAAVLTGTAVTDTATISGGNNPTGSVTFEIFSDNQCLVPVVPAYTSTVQLVGSQATSAPYTPTSAQTLYWEAGYNGDGNNNAVGEPCTAANEQTAVTDPIPPPPPVKASPTITTSATSLVSIPSAALGGAGPTVQDVATLHSGSNPTGTIEFKLYGPIASSTPNCSGPAFATVSAPVAGGQAVSPAVAVSQVGYYFWTASYSGDSNNNPAGPTACGDAGETSQAAQGDLGLSKVGLVDGSDPNATILQPGDAIHYTVSIPNSGNADINDAVVTDTLPAYVVVDQATISDGGVFTAGNDITTSAGKVVWTGVDLPAGATTHLTYTVHVSNDAPQGQLLTNLVELGALSAATQHQVASGKLTVEKDVNKHDAEFGDTLTYTLVVKAHGTLVENDVNVTDYIPGYDPAEDSSGLTTYVDGSADCDAGTCHVSYDASSHQLTWGLGTMNPGDERAVTFQVTIDTPNSADDGAIPAEDLLNAGVVSSSENADPVPSNQVKTVVLAVLGIREVRNPPTKAPELPFTGAAVPLNRGLAIGVALLMLGLATAASGYRRRRTG